MQLGDAPLRQAAMEIVLLDAEPVPLVRTVGLRGGGHAPRGNVIAACVIGACVFAAAPAEDRPAPWYNAGLKIAEGRSGPVSRKRPRVGRRTCSGQRQFGCCGLAASAIFGGLLGEFLMERGAYIGMVGGAFAFACARICLMGR